MQIESLGKGNVTIDLEAATVTYRCDGTEVTYPLASDSGFSLVSDAWLRAGYDCKYSYGFTWFGRPVIQLPEDMIRVQEIVWQLKPDVIVETGVAHGGGQTFFASLCEAMGRGRVIGVELELRPDNRAALDAHPLRPLITLIDGSSTAPDVVAKVRGEIKKGETVLIVLDSNHTADHVLKELEVYGPMVTPGSYIIATDGVMHRLAGTPHSRPDWQHNNPFRAIGEFLKAHPEFESINPPPPFNKGCVTTPITYWPSGYLRRK